MQVGNFANEVPGQVEHFQLCQTVEPGNLGIEYLADERCILQTIFGQKRMCYTGYMKRYGRGCDNAIFVDLRGAAEASENGVLL